MTLPLQITFRHCDQSQAIIDVIEERAAKLDRFFERIISCRVMVEAPHKSHNKGNLYRVRIDLTVPGEELVVGQDRARGGAHEDVYVAIRDAFAAIQRQLQDYVHRMRRETKQHLAYPIAKVTRLFPAEDYGFLETGDGRQVYFHRNAVLGGDFDRLKVGSEVRFVEHPGEGFNGPQASTVEVAAPEPRLAS